MGRDLSKRKYVCVWYFTVTPQIRARQGQWQPVFLTLTPARKHNINFQRSQASITNHSFHPLVLSLPIPLLISFVSPASPSAPFPSCISSPRSVNRIFKFIIWNLIHPPKPSPIWFLYLRHQSGVSHFLTTMFQWILRAVPIISGMSAIFETHGCPFAFYFPSYGFFFLLNCFIIVSTFGFFWEGFFLLVACILHLDFR